MTHNGQLAAALLDLLVVYFCFPSLFASLVNANLRNLLALPGYRLVVCRFIFMSKIFSLQQYLLIKFIIT
jgi:hypothetical protein